MFCCVTCVVRDACRHMCTCDVIHVTRTRIGGSNVTADTLASNGSYAHYVLMVTAISSQAIANASQAMPDLLRDVTPLPLYDGESGVSCDVSKYVRV